jgi:leader peptidase (prepilin peptidase)/N-methyltransferase
MSRPWELPVLAVLLAVVVTVGAVPAAVPLVAVAAVTPELARVDVLEHRLPNRIVLPCYAACAAGLVAAIGSGGAAALALVSGAATAAFLAVLGVRGGMGMGDVKLGGVLGIAAGLLGLTAAVLALLVAFVLGGIVAVGAARRGVGTRIPFGPFLLSGFWCAVVLSGAA